MSEFFPHPPDRMVFGVFQRLRCTLQGLARAGHLDAAFLWSDNYQPPDPIVEEHRKALAAAWSFSGALRIISVSSGRFSEWHGHPLRALYGLLRGAASFMHNRPTLRCCGPHQLARLRHALEEFQPDLILAHRTGVAGALMRLSGALPPILLDLEDIDHVKIRRIRQDAAGRRDGLRTAFYEWIARRSERRAARLAQCTMVCSEPDRAALQSVAPGARIEVVPNTASPSAPLPPADAPSALFVGVAHFPPHRDAIQWLATEIWPRVRQRVPDARLLLVGDGTPEVPADRSAGGIEAIGFAEDLGPHYSRARICVCPIRSGSGTRIKIIEAAMRARAIVSTSIGAEGLDFEPGRELLIADDEAGFADACAELLLNPVRCATIGAAARIRAAARYAPDAVMTRIAALARELMPSARGAP